MIEITFGSGLIDFFNSVPHKYYAILVAFFTGGFYKLFYYKFISHYNTFRCLKKIKLTWGIILFEGVVASIIFYVTIIILKIDISFPQADEDIFLEAILIGLLSRKITYIEIPKNVISDQKRIDFGIVRSKLESDLRIKHYNKKREHIAWIKSQLEYSSVEELRRILKNTIPLLSVSDEGEINKAEDDDSILMIYYEEYGDSALVEKGKIKKQFLQNQD